MLLMGRNVQIQQIETTIRQHNPDIKFFEIVILLDNINSL